MKKNDWQRLKERIALPEEKRPLAYLDDLRRRAQEERAAEEKKRDKQLDLFG